MSVASQSGLRPIDVNGGEEVVAVGSGDPGSLSEEKEEETEAGEEERGVVKMLDPGSQVRRSGATTTLSTSRTATGANTA